MGRKRGTLILCTNMVKLGIGIGVIDDSKVCWRRCWIGKVMNAREDNAMMMMMTG